MPDNNPSSGSNNQPDNHISFFTPKVLWVIIGVLLIVVLASCIAWWQTIKETDQALNQAGTNDLAGWQTYQSQEYGFVMSLPSGWTARSYNTDIYPVIEITGREGQIYILPKGAEIPPYRRLGTSNDGIEYATREGQVFAYRMNYDEVPDSWESFGMVYGQARIENVQEHATNGMDIPVSAQVNNDDVAVIKQILSTFKFTNSSNTRPVITYPTDGANLSSTIYIQGTAKPNAEIGVYSGSITCVGNDTYRAGGSGKADASGKFNFPLAVTAYQKGSITISVTDIDPPREGCISKDNISDPVTFTFTGELVQ